MDRDPHGYVVHRLVSRHKPHKLQITRVGVASRGFKSAFSDLYHVLLDFTWWKLLVGVSVLYLGMNLLFALLFYWDTQGIVNMVNHSGVAGYRDCFFFSVQTWETIGFGLWSPLSPYVNAVATVEAYFSTLFTAVLTGCVFAKISRPSRIAREFVFSDVAVVSFKQTYFQAARANGRSELESQHQTMITSESSSTSALHSLQGTTKVTRPSYEEYPRLVLRVCSMRKSQLCVPEFTLLLLQKETPDGREPGLSDSRHVFRMHQLKFDINDQLGLGTNISPHLPLPWTIVHLMNSLFHVT
ncbi:K+ channel protein [Pelomyxa schiedti]|nr:K+ channel protein [Pelomyxa schiedti]